MELFDVLKARAGVPVDDPLAMLFARKSAEPAAYVPYQTSDDLILKTSDDQIYLVKEES